MNCEVIVVSMNYKPELTGIGKYSGEMSEWLVSNNCKVHVITSPPYYPAWKVTEGYSRFLYKQENLGGVDVIRCPIWVPRKATSIKRIIHLMTFAITSFPIIIYKAIKIKPDLIFVVEPPLFSSLGCIIGSKVGKSALWLHIQDFEVDAAFNLGFMKSKTLRSVILKIERWLYNKTDVLSTISEQMMRVLKDKTRNEKDYVMYKNWVDLKQIFPTESTIYREKYNIDQNTKIFLYSGNMGKKQGLEIIIDSAKKLQHKRNDILFLLCGEGVIKEQLKRISKDISSVKIIPLQPVELLNDLLNTADVHLLPQQADADGLVMPSKLTNMLASGKPTIATVSKESEIATVLDGAGITTEPGNVDQFINAIEVLADSAEIRDKFGKQARKNATNHYNRDSILSSVFHEYVSMVG